MHVVVTGRTISLTSSIDQSPTEKLQRAQKHFHYPLEVQALLSVAKNPSIAESQTAEVTIKVNGNIIRGEESTENMYASIDLVANKIERQLRKFKTRYFHKGNKTKEREAAEPIDVSSQVDTDEVVQREL